MNSPILDLRTIQKHPVPQSVPFGRNAFTSHAGVALLIGLFTVVFGTTLIFAQDTAGKGGVFARSTGKGGANMAFLGEALGEEPDPADAVPVEVVLYKDPFEGLTIEADAAYVFDVASGKVLYEKNKNEKLPLASITKVMTAFTAANILDDDDIVTIGEDDLATEGESGLTLGERWHMQDLLDLTLIVSSNDGSEALASSAGSVYAKTGTSTVRTSGREAFVDAMNAEARKIGMNDSVFYNASGLDITDTRSGGVGTAHDIGLLYAHILKNEPHLFEATRRGSLSVASLDGVAHSVKNTNQSVVSFPGIIGSKTGYTDLAGGNLAVVFDSGLGTPIIIVVLGSSTEGRFRDVSLLSKAALEAVGQGIY